MTRTVNGTGHRLIVRCATLIANAQARTPAVYCKRLFSRFVLASVLQDANSTGLEAKPKSLCAPPLQL